MANRQVKCCTPDGSDLDRRIDGLGGIDEAGRGWWEDTDTIIDDIQLAQHRYWVVASGKSVWVVVREHANGRKYLTTEADSFPPNNLLNLPAC